MDVSFESINLATATDNELRDAAMRIRGEITRRRRAEDQVENAGRLAREVEEVKAGTRQARIEHIMQLNPSETVALVETGALAHLGIGSFDSSSNDWITIPEAARRLSVSPALVRLWARSGRIRSARKVGRDWSLPAAAIEDIRVARAA
jgi:excisionase family DNA binding protein